MACTSTLSIISLFIIVVVGLVSCCSIPVGWKPKSPGKRARQADMVLMVKVISSPTRWVVSKDKDDGVNSARFVKAKGLYQATVQVYCIFKGDSLPRIVNVSNFGHTPGHCVSTEAIQGEKGILFVTRGYSGELVVHTPNVQTGLIPATDKNLWKVSRSTVAHLHYPKLPIGTRSGCPKLSSLDPYREP